MLIGAIIVVALAVLGVLVWMFWSKGAPQATDMANNNVPVSNVNKGTVPEASGGTVTPPVANVPAYVPSAVPVNIQSIPAGLNRQITPEERVKYGLSPTDDIWVRTTSPTDGSTPQLTFYNKTVNPSPQPYVNPPEPLKKQ